MESKEKKPDKFFLVWCDDCEAFSIVDDYKGMMCFFYEHRGWKCAELSADSFDEMVKHTLRLSRYFENRGLDYEFAVELIADCLRDDLNRETNVNGKELK